MLFNNVILQALSSGPCPVFTDSDRRYYVGSNYSILDMMGKALSYEDCENRPGFIFAGALNYFLLRNMIISSMEKGQVTVPVFKSIRQCSVTETVELFSRRRCAILIEANIEYQVILSEGHLNLQSRGLEYVLPVQSTNVFGHFQLLRMFRSSGFRISDETFRPAPALMPSRNLTSQQFLQDEMHQHVRRIACPSNNWMRQFDSRECTMADEGTVLKQVVVDE